MCAPLKLLSPSQWLPPRQDQALNQGGMYIFEGQKVLFSHKDPATGAHADLQQVLGTALAGFGKEDCGCDTKAAA